MGAHLPSRGSQQGHRRVFHLREQLLRSTYAVGVAAVQRDRQNSTSFAGLKWNAVVARERIAHGRPREEKSAPAPLKPKGAAPSFWAALTALRSEESPGAGPGLKPLLATAFFREA